MKLEFGSPEDTIRISIQYCTSGQVDSRGRLFLKRKLRMYIYIYIFIGCIRRFFQRFKSTFCGFSTEVAYSVTNYRHLSRYCCNSNTGYTAYKALPVIINSLIIYLKIIRMTLV